MRWLALLSWALFALFGCSSTPLDAPIDEPIVQDGRTSPSAPLGVSDGNFRKIAPYPAGPYGNELGSIIADHVFLGWRDPPGAGFDSTRLEELMLSDYHDPEGRQTELIVVNASAVWCPACRLEMETIDALDLADRYRASKVALFGTLFEDVTGAPAKPEDLTLWASGLGFVVDFPLGLDPGLKLGPYFSQAATPLNLVIDARTMEILEVFMGYGDGLWLSVDRELSRRGVSPPVQ